MSGSERKRQPRGVPVGGQFATEDRQDSADLAVQNDLAGSSLDGVLSGYGLQDWQVPGLREKWAETFAPLSQPCPEDPPAMADRILDYPIYGRHRSGPVLAIRDDDSDDGHRPYEGGKLGPDDKLVLAVLTRNGGNSRDHEHEDDAHHSDCLGCIAERLEDHPLHLTTIPNSWDSTYETYLFKVPAEHRRGLLEAYARSDEARAWQTLKQQQDEIVQGKRPPWSILARPEDVARNSERSGEESRKVLGDYQRDAFQKERGVASRLIDMLDMGQVLEGHERIVLSTQLPGHPMRIDISSGQVASIGAEAKKARDEVRRFGDIRRDIASGNLSPALMDYLVGEREQKSYKVNKGTQRRPRIVTETYTPKSDFLDEEERAQKANERASEKFREARGILSGAVARADEKLAESQAARHRLSELEDERWALGWTGSPRDLPARPHSGPGSDDGL